MYSDKYNRKSSRWDDVRSYYQQSYRNDRKHSNASANFDDRESERREMKEAITAIVQHSGILGLKKEKIEGDEEQQPSSSIDESKDQTRPSSSSSSVAIIENDPNRNQSPRFQQLEVDKANYLLPTFDHLSNFSPSIQCRKFFEDIQPLDRILARIVRIGVAVIHVELVCTLTRFRRNLLAFMKGKLQAVAFDRTRRFYQVNDYISTTVMAVSPNTAELELQLDEDEAIYTHQGIPAYSRDFAPVDFDESSHISHLRDNPNLGLQLGVQINSRHSGLPKLAGKHLHLAPTAEKMRKEQIAKLAMTHVVRGAELTRQNKCFEAIQCFNKALAVDAECADAFVGRGAACAGMRNFEAALQDFDKAIQLQPNHRNGNKYRLEVLIAFGRDLEKSGNLEEARAKFDRILELNPGNPKALEAIQRINKAEKDKRAKEEEEIMLELSEEEEEEEEKGKMNGRNGYGRKRNDTMTEEEAKRNREKLNEMEEFIRKLKSTEK